MEIKSKYTIEMGTPEYGMSDRAREYFGLTDKKLYKAWQKHMKKLWKKRTN